MPDMSQIPLPVEPHHEGLALPQLVANDLVDLIAELFIELVTPDEVKEEEPHDATS